MSQYVQQPALFDRTDNNEQSHEEEDGDPLHFGEGVMDVFRLLFRRLLAVGEQHQEGSAG